MYVALYHWRIHPGREVEFAELWRAGSELFLSEQGSLGSRLHRAEDGTYFSYAQWPDRRRYHAEKTLSPAHMENLRRMRECIAEWFPTVLGTPVHDLLVRGD